MSNQAFIVEGGHRLSGTLQPQGAKNEALQVISAVLLTSSPVVIQNIPNILDVNRLIDLLKGLGVKVKDLGSDTMEFQADDIDLEFFASKEYLAIAQKIRGSVMLIGPDRKSVV